MTWKLLLIPLFLYVLVAVVLFFAQTAILFPSSRVPAAGPPPPGSEPLELVAASGERLAGLHIPPAGPTWPAGNIIAFWAKNKIAQTAR